MKRFLSLILAAMLLLSVAAPSYAGAEEALPTKWDLSVIYAGADEWMADYETVMAMLEQYEQFRGTLNNAQSIYDYFQFSHYTELTRLQDKLCAYAQLGSSLDAADPFFAELAAKYAAMALEEEELSGFALPEIFELSLEEREAILADPLFDGYRYALQALVDPTSEPLGEEASTALATLSLALGYPYAVFDCLEYVDLPYPSIVMPDGTERDLTEELYSDIVNSTEYDRAFKEEVSALRYGRPKPFINTFAKLLEGNAMEAIASALLSDYESTRAYAMDLDDVDPAIYDMLIETAHDGLEYYHRFLDAHARGLGLEEQYSFDLFLPVSDFDPGKTDYEDAVAEVTNALSILGEEYMDTFNAILRSGHVDVYPSEGKESGEYSTQPSGDYLPWVLFNYNGYASDISNIAHELGHAVYSALSTACQPIQNRVPTIFTQEVASTTNELLYYRYMMDQAADDDERLYYLEKCLDMFSKTFFSQMHLAEFEDYFYSVLESGGVLDAEDLSDEYYALNSLYYGSRVTFPQNVRYRWADITHFYDVYYVYKYASAVSYAASISERIFSGEEGAIDDYLAFLKAGASGSPQTLLAIAGIDPLREETYQEAMAYYASMVEEYESLVDAKLAAENAA